MRTPADLAARYQAGTASRWRRSGVPGYAVAYLLAVERMTDAERAAYRDGIYGQKGNGA